MSNPDHINAGYILLDKSIGPSSHGAVQQVRRTLGIGGKRGTKGGHGGTLDPFASGLLVVLLGGATRLMPFVVGHDKRYLVDVRFGASSTTDDIDGDLTPSDSPPPTEAAVREALPALAAATEQIPPAVSALHIDGVRAYTRVRRGERVEVPPRPIRFDQVEIVDWQEPQRGDDHGPMVRLDVRCATGTYMRALARDLGDAVGCPAYCDALRRTEVGEWNVADAVTVESVTRAHVRDPLELVPELPHVQLDEAQLADVIAGRRLPSALLDEDREAAQLALIAPDGTLAAIGEPTSDGTLLQPRIVLARAQ